VSLWKYLDLAKFIALLQKESLHFCRGDKFADPFEGSYPLSALDAFESGSSGYSAEAWKKFVAVTCWHNSDTESDAMWRLYTSNKQGVVIKTTWKKLESAIEDHAYLKSVEYIDFIKDNAKIHIPSDVFEYKRKAYTHENEVRAIITKYPKVGIEDGVPLNSKPIAGEEIPESGVFVELNLTKLIENIVVTPYSEPWFVDIVTSVAEKYGLPSGIVIESELKADPVYANI
jgi:hypothetical protein